MQMRVFIIPSLFTLANQDIVASLSWNPDAAETNNIPPFFPQAPCAPWNIFFFIEFFCKLQFIAWAERNICFWERGILVKEKGSWEREKNKYHWEQVQHFFNIRFVKITAKRLTSATVQESFQALLTKCDIQQKTSQILHFNTESRVSLACQGQAATQRHQP